MTAPAEMPGVEEIARALISHFVEHTGFTTVDEDETKTCVSAYYGGVWVYLRVYPIARAILDLFAPILAEKEREIERANELLKGDELLERCVLSAILIDQQTGQIEALESRALAAEAALAAERERAFEAGYQAGTKHTNAWFNSMPHDTRAQAFEAYASAAAFHTGGGVDG